MKNSLLVLGITLAAVSGLAFSSSAPQQSAADHKIEILEKDLLATRQRVESLSSELNELHTQVDASVKYLAAQAASAKSLGAVLDQSEQAGFTWGINPDSRHVLLKGWRDQIAAAQKDLPKPSTIKPEAKDDKGAPNR